jgi:hypothetical protein
MPTYGLGNFDPVSRKRTPDDPFAPTGGISDAIKNPGFGGNKKSAKDIAGHLLRFADITYGKREPFEDWSLNFLGDIAQGGGQYLNQLMAPGMNALSAQLPQAQRRLGDTMSGGALAEGRVGLEENMQGAQSQMLGQMINWGLSQLLDTGLGAPGQAAQMLTAAGQLAKDPPKGGGMS